MNRKGNIYLNGAIVILALLGTAIAIIPPPPVNQDLGVYDTLFGDLAENECRVCHNSGVPDRHHLLVPNENYNCTDCHPVETQLDGTQAINLTRDCMACHLKTPHHETQDALDKHCSNCHGNIVDDFDDGHYIPDYPVSLVTPDTRYKVINETTDKKWGGCQACHEPDDTMTPQIYSTKDTHHTLGSVSGFDPANNTKCMTCHSSHHAEYGPLFIRYCERCHGVRSLHNIQYDYTNTSGTLGYGHIGEDWDCKGCHAWYVAGSESPFTSNLVPSIDALGPSRLVAGEPIVMSISGSNFENTGNNITYSSVVVLDDGINTITLIPDTISASAITIAVPALDVGTYELIALKDDIKSNKLSIVVVPSVSIDSAVISGENVLITGSGFGDKPSDLYADWLGVTVVHVKNKKVVTLDCDIVSWIDSQIVVGCPEISPGDTATVVALYGSDSVGIKSDEQQQPKPTKKPKK